MREHPKLGVGARTQDIGGEDPRPVSAFRNIESVRVRAEPVDAVADADGSFDINFLERAIVVEINHVQKRIHVSSQDKTTGTRAAVDAQNLILVVAYKHP